MAEQEGKQNDYVSTDPETGEVVVKLRFPVEHGGKQTRDVRLRGEAVVSDLEAMDKGSGQVQKIVYLAAELSGLSLAVVRKLRSVDFGEVSAAVDDILGKEPPRTGESS